MDVRFIMELKTIGTVHSSIKSRENMPVQGIDAVVEIFEEYSEGLAGIDGNSHIFVICWLHEADRTVLKAVPRKISPGLPEQGVFSMRSPSRPNPVSITVARLQSRAGRLLYVSNLDAIDGTPVIDIKPYQAGWDCIFSAKNSDRTDKIKKMMPDDYKESLVREAMNYHGEKCVGLALAVRMAMVASYALDCDMRRSDVSIIIGKNSCISDSLIGITGARLGTGRLLYNLSPKLTLKNDSYSIFNDEKTVVFKIKKFMKDFNTILDCDANDLFNIDVL